MTQEPIQNLLEDIIQETPFGAQKVANQDVQFAVDPSFGLTRARYGWLTNGTLFDSTFFSESGGEIVLETGATGTDFARIRSAFPGQYVSQTLAEPGLGVTIPAEHIERDADDLTSLTHGEITLGAIEVDPDTESGVNTLALSFESDATYFQVRTDNADTAKVPQTDWNIDPLDGTGPSGKILKPEEGLIYNFPFSWYGHGSLFAAVQDTKSSKLVPVHKFKASGGVSLGTPNMPVQLAVQNLGTAEPLSAKLGGMQWTTFGSEALTRQQQGRVNKTTRRTTTSYIDRNVTITNNAVDPFAQPGRPLISYRRDQSELEARTALRLDTSDVFIASGGNLYIFAFDEYDAENSLTGENFRDIQTQQHTEESKIQVDTEATDYTPGPNAVLRSIVFISSDKNSPSVIAGDASTRLPIEATSVLTAALPVGANSVGAQPAIGTIREGY